jgi:hypothetical protein
MHQVSSFAQYMLFDSVKVLVGCKSRRYRFPMCAQLPDTHSRVTPSSRRPFYLPVETTGTVRVRVTYRCGLPDAIREILQSHGLPDESKYPCREGQASICDP